MKVHFIGIGGIGMSSIARMALKEGWEVTGSDSRQSEMIRQLADEGAFINTGHKASHVSDQDIVVYSSSISQKNPELKQARKNNIKVFHRAEMLAFLTKDFSSIAIAGSHGKTTTTGLVGAALEKTLLSPTVVVGGNFSNYGGNFKSGNSRIVVFEADESDSSFLHYSPDQIIITNIDNDHLDTYGSLEGVRTAFIRFLDRLKPGGVWIGCYECPSVRDLLQSYGREGVSYGFHESCDYRAVNLKQNGLDGMSFEVHLRNIKIGTLTVPVFGKHNVLNALSACAAAIERGCNFSDVAEGLRSFSRPARRCQIKFSSKDHILIDDYAHHPSEIRATIQALQSAGIEDMCVVFQPHRYSRTLQLEPEFIDSLKNLHHVIITDIYSAGENPLKGVSGKLLADRLRECSNGIVEFVSRDRLIHRWFENLPEEKNWITMGAGDIGRFADDLTCRLESQNVEA